MSAKRILHWSTTMALLLSVMVWLSACGGDSSAASPASGQGATGQNGAPQGEQFGGVPFDSAYLTNTYESALPTTMQLTLGMLKLEEGDQAITPEEAGKLLPLWQAIQGGSITNATERNAVYKSIESTMDAAQLQAIAAMNLTFTDMTEWASANGIELPQGAGQFGQGRQNGGGANSPLAALTDEQRAELRNLSPEERQARLKELGIEIPQGGFGGGNGGGGNGTGGTGQNGGGNGNQGRGGGRFNVLMEPLIQLLTIRAAE